MINKKSIGNITVNGKILQEFSLNEVRQKIKMPAITSI